MPELNEVLLYASDEIRVMIAEVELLKSLLTFCMNKPGAKITVTVEHDDGNKVTAHLYDHAALTQSLYDTLTYFESEL